MSFLFHRSGTVRGAVRGYILAFLALALVPVWLLADAPTWWTQRGVLDTAPGVADDYAAVNQGQVRNISKQAYEEMKAKLPGGAGSILDAIWAAPAAGTDDYQAVNLGQIKSVAKPFYDRLHEAGYTGQPLASGRIYPWEGVAAADDYALANIGQVKNLFSFVITSAPADPNDLDGDGMLDSWEAANLGDMSHTPNGDADGDGVSNLAEFRAGTNPNLAATVVSATTVSLIIFSP